MSLNPRRHLASFVAIAGLLLAGLAMPPAITHANGVAFAQDDVFTDVGSGTAAHFNNTGTLRDTLNDGTGSFYTTGDCFDASNNLYVTNFAASTISKFDKNGNLIASVWATTPGTPESCIFDASGNMYIGGPGHASIFKFSPTGSLLATINVQPNDGTGGTDWIDLASDQCTMLYASEGATIKSFNICTNAQNATFAGALPGPCYALRFRPNGEVIIACGGEAVRLSSAGAVLQTYPVGNGSLFALNLDPDGTSFWTADTNTNNVFRVRISDGAVLTTFNGSPSGSTVFGLAVFGEIVVSVDNTPPSCALTGVIAGPPKQIQITVQDSDGGLKSIVVTESSNATTPVPSFTTGTTSPVIVTATKIDQSAGAQVALQVTDMAGNVTNCDPVLTGANRADGKPATRQVDGVGHADHLVHIYNDSPGVGDLTITVNGQAFRLHGLGDGQQATLDIAAALRGDTNNVSLTSTGKPGGSATLLFGNM